MKHAIWTLVVCAFAATASAQAKPMARPAAKSATADKLIAAEHKMMADLTKHDADAFFAAVAPGSWSVDEMGPVSIDDFRKSWDQIKVESAKLSDVKVVAIDANAGIVTYRLDQKGTYMGQPFPPTTYATTVWVNKGGKWQAVFHQESAAAPMKK